MTLWPQKRPSQTLTQLYWSVLDIVCYLSFTGSFLVYRLHMAHLSGKAYTPLEKRGDELHQRLPIPLYGLFAHRVPDQWHCVRLFDGRKCNLHIYNGHNSVENQGSIGAIYGQSGSKAVSGGPTPIQRLKFCISKQGSSVHTSVCDTMICATNKVRPTLWYALKCS